MTDVLAELLRVLHLERIEENIFRGDSQDLGWGRVFGGQVVGQAVSAAEKTVPEPRRVHSLHAYFLRPGDAAAPIVYMVDPIRDGGSFSTRRVVAIQHGKPIFNMSASFQGEEGGFDHHDPMPDSDGPTGLMSEQELSTRYLAGLPDHVREAVPPKMRERAVADRPIEIRIVQPLDPVRPKIRPPHRQVWFRAAGKLPDDPTIHRYMLAYASDFHFLVTSMQPHGASWLTPGLQVATLSHAMWFLRPFRMDEWLLYDVVSPSASNARGLVQGRFFRRDGTLVAVAVQEGLIRDRRK
jgi:acyl-CoA thioesterase II